MFFNSRYAFLPPGSPRVWTDEKLAELNAPKYEYQGEQLTEYEARQKEKYFDRQIHRWNREAEAMKAAGQDSAEARAKVKEWTAKKRDFLQNRVDLPSQSADLTDHRKQQLPGKKYNKCYSVKRKGNLRKDNWALVSRRNTWQS